MPGHSLLPVTDTNTYLACILRQGRGGQWHASSGGFREISGGSRARAVAVGACKGCTRVHAVNGGAGAAVLPTLATSYWRRYRYKGGSSPLAAPSPTCPSPHPSPRGAPSVPAIYCRDSTGLQHSLQSGARQPLARPPPPAPQCGPSAPGSTRQARGGADMSVRCSGRAAARGRA